MPSTKKAAPQEQHACSERVILLVEDNVADIVLFKRALAKVGVSCEIVEARHGDEAVDYLASTLEEAARSDRPTHVVLDLRLPGRNGFEVLEWIRRHNEVATLPVVILSSSKMEQDIQTAQQLGIDGYFAKPTSFKELVQIVERMATTWGWRDNVANRTPSANAQGPAAKKELL
jgi:two-component system response regulator